MTILHVPGEEVSLSVPPLLRQWKTGTVHSIFHNGCNIRIGNSLLFIGNCKNGCLPFGIHLNNEDTENVMPLLALNDRLFWNDCSKTLQSSTVSIQIDQSQYYDSRIFILTDSLHMVTHLKRFTDVLSCSGRASGLDISFSNVRQILTGLPKEAYTESEHQLRQLVRALFSDDPLYTEECLRYFIGRGPGLTPSGDDLLVGILAVDAACCLLSPVFKKTLLPLIHNHSLTTDVSKEYLRHALHGDFSSLLIAVINGLSAITEDIYFIDYVNHLLRIGHSSGSDTALGILICLLAIEEKITSYR